MQNIFMHIGLRIKRLMKERNISVKTAAAHCGVTPGAVSNWFSSGRITKENLAKMAVLLQTELAELITGDAAPEVLEAVPEGAPSREGAELAYWIDRVPVALRQKVYASAVHLITAGVSGRLLTPMPAPLKPEPSASTSEPPHAAPESARTPSRSHTGHP